MKRLVVCLDGTWSRPTDRTNVHRFRELVAERDAADVRQVAQYWSGVGTRWLEMLRGGAFGFGTGRTIREAYTWLRDRYDDGDEVYIVGFSRGAYSARSLAGMIARCGLLRRDATTTVQQVYDRYAKKEAQPVPDARRIPIQFVGVWDTVGALGVPWGRIPGISRATLFHDTSPSRSYRSMAQALAIDENRPDFEPTLWTAGEGFSPGPDQRIEQRWFVGSHSDVGGGGGRARPLATQSLAWMQEQAGRSGLAFTQRVVPAPADPAARIEDSFATFLLGAYRLARHGRPYERPIGREVVSTPTGPARPLAESVDGSVFDRWRVDPRYRPANLARWAAGRGLDPGTVHGTVPARATVP